MAKVLNFFCSSFSHSVKRQAIARSFHLSIIDMAKVGEPLPSLELTEGTPGTKINISDLCKDKKVVLFAVPGAFTPGCSKTHLPGYVSRFDEIKSKGVDEIICVSVNDAFVMDAWGKDQNATGKIRMLADADGTFTKALGLDMNIPPLGGVRSKRYAMVIENNVIKQLSVEPDGTGLSCSLAEKLAI